MMIVFGALHNDATTTARVGEITSAINGTLNNAKPKPVRRCTNVANATMTTTTTIASVCGTSSVSDLDGHRARPDRRRAWLVSDRFEPRGPGRVATVPDSERAPDHWFEPLADHLGSAYLRYSFTKGTVQEVDALVDWLGLGPGMSVLDVGCGPGRHSLELARRGIVAHGIDVSQSFVDLAVDAAASAGLSALATFERLDARVLGDVAGIDGRFDAAVSLCQGAFGLLAADDETLAVLDGMARAVRLGGRIAVSAFSAYFSVRYQTEADFDAATGVAHEHTELRDSAGAVAPAELWTTCFTPRELRLLAAASGLEVVDVWSVEPGSYRANLPTTESPEFLLLAARPRSGQVA